LKIVFVRHDVPEPICSLSRPFLKGAVDHLV